MNLELKHLAPYLPYGLKCQNPKNYYYSGCRIDCQHLTMCGLRDDFISFDEVSAFYPIAHFNPILRPLSDLTKEIEVNGERFMPYKKLIAGYPVGGEYEQLVLKSISSKGNYIMLTPYLAMKQLFEWNFDVFGLIEAGLAIDINTLNQ